MNSETDEAIVRRVREGDSESFGILVQRYEAKIFRYVRKFLFGYEDAEDGVQEVFIKAYKNLQSFDTDRKFSTWLYRIAHNECINIIKKKGREQVSFFDPDTIFPHPVSSENAEQSALERETKEILDTCLDTLDPKYREPLILFYFEEMDYQTIAEVMHIPVSTVGVRIKRAKEALTNAYQQLFPSHV